MTFAELLDLEEDPDELVNFIDDDKHRAVARDLARELKAYGARHRDPYTKHPATSAYLARLAG